ncbi:Sterol regulatory element-binding protein cleavage-activating protein [Cordyceps fumosorosea ARSEF 2679]|uniref:Sterol regulatory element-binding protein cleavage-activating protein n=1 Tax=Cordyceps fumosorosea (strain ARSEF 2679) TaxID=1081104 RepID=A0A167YEJ6_CORFA|nr:Sterol regulatory element-binding protein cleavage-activating protein [Cordyceps fumosorosea ARSEF 2679]OAA66236.1 Sterol regulatory element-binding protein cleavage-activating protein [Cordyceps fumosorosea ARSEF 2679]
MIWYLLYPLRGTTEAPALSPSNPLRIAFTRYANYIARHVILALLISGIVATILIYPIPYLFTDDFTNGASNLPHHVWTVAQPLGRGAPVLPDIVMRSIWVHGDYMQALDHDLLASALELQDALLGPTEKFSPAAARGISSSVSDSWPMPAKNRDAVHIVNGLTNQSWFFHSPLLYWDCSRQQILADTDLIATVNEKKTQSTSANITLRHSIVFSGKKFAERRLLAADALVITLLYLRESPVGRQWEHNAPLLTQKAKDKWDIYPPDGEIESSQVYEFQFRPLSLYDVISLALAYGLMGIYFLASLSKLRAIKSKAGLTVTVITQILVSIMSSLTVCAVFDIDLSRIPRAAYPLVIFAMSLENMFRIIYAVILMPAENSSSSRVGSAFGQTAHIALASTLQNVAILAGLSTIVSQGVAGFCIFAAIATIFDFFYLSTFFLSVLSVDVRRTELQDELTKASRRKHNHAYCQLKERPSWISNLMKGRVALSTRIAGTIVMVGFVTIAQWHFFGHVGVWEPAKRLFGTSTWPSSVGEVESSPLKDIHQARSPGSWLRLQDHETAQEVINAIKPSAISYTAKVYDPLVFVLKNSDRTPPQRKKKFLPAAYDFVDHQLAEFVISIVLVGACLRLLASYLLLADEETRDDSSDSDENSSLYVRSLSGGHILDIAMIATSSEGRIVSAGLDRTIRVWDVRSNGTGYELPGTRLLDGRELFPVLGMAMDAESKWLAIMSMTQIRLWSLVEYAWSPPIPLQSGSHNPEVFCFHPRSTQQSPRLVIVRKDGTLLDVFISGNDCRREANVCEGLLLTARALTYKVVGSESSTTRAIQILSLSRNGGAFISRETATGWKYKSLPLNVVSDTTLHQVVPLSPHPLFLVGSISSVYLVSANHGVVQHVFATEPMVPRSIQCEYSDNRYNVSLSGIGFSSLTLGYVAAKTEECIITSYQPAEGNEAIAACAPSGGAGGGWCTWGEAIETNKRIKDPGTWDVVKGRSIIGVRQEAKGPRNTKRGDQQHRRSAAAARGKLGAATRWQAWTAATDEHLDADEVRPLHSNEPGSEEFLVVPGLGPKAKIGVRSAAFCLGNTIKVVSAGGPERYQGDDDTAAETMLAKDGRRGRHGGSKFFSTKVMPPGPALAGSLDQPSHHHQAQANSATRLPEQLVSGLTTYWMASSEVDQKFLGRLARAVEHDNPLLSSMLFKILGLSLNLAEQLVAAKKQRKPTPVTSPLFLRRILHILWLSREGLVMLEQYVIPMVGNYVELKVLAYKLRASFHHIFVLFHNSPPVSTIGSWTPEAISAAFAPIYKDGRGPLGVDGDPISRSSSVQPTHALEGGPVGPPPGFETQVALLPPSVLMPEQDFLPTAQKYFREAMDLADQLLWGSHSLRLSVKTEYAAFLYECVHDAESSRQLAKKTVAEVYDATEGMDDDMFRDACELVTVLGKMMKRGLVRTTSSAAKGKRVDVNPPTSPIVRSAPGMENAI